jgi:hypothetical protein
MKVNWRYSMNAQRFTSCLMLVFVLRTCPVWGDTINDDSLPGMVAIQTPQEAVKRVFEYTGFNEIKEFSKAQAEKIARLSIAKDSTTPFLCERINGAKVWEVTLDSIYLDLPSWDPDWVKKYNPKSFIALIDSATGQLLKIFSEYKGYDPDLVAEPPAKLAEQSVERWTDFPAGPPKVSFLKALNAAAGSNSLKAKEIIAVCVMQSLSGDTSEPVWSIIGRGIPAVPGILYPRNDAPLYTRNRSRSVVNATTGQLLFVTNRPQVEVREKKK